MQNVIEAERSIPVAGEADVIVVGGGIAGIYTPFQFDR